MTNPRMTQLERDLLTNAKHRLHLWIKDTKMRGEAVDFTHPQIVCLIITALSEELAYAFAALGASREDFLTCMQQVYEHELRLKKRREAGENS